MYRRLRPLLFLLPPEVAHSVALRALGLLPRAALPDSGGAEAMGLRFPNRVGLAAGFDKTGAHADALAKIGFGFVEAGTFTPQPQAGNPKPRLFRIVRHESLLNRLGFNNPGCAAAAARLRKLRKSAYILGINIGKGAATPLEKAARDYAQCLEALYGIGDYFTINVSSPNTPGLRSLEEGKDLANLLDEVVQVRERLARGSVRKPLVVKLSPDMADVAKTCATIADSGIDGVIACNTSLQEPGTPGANPAVPPALPRGGLSGRAMAEASMRTLEAVRVNLPDRLALVACGGISDAREARRRLDAGADLVQLYTGLVYCGPGLVRELVSATGGR